MRRHLNFQNQTQSLLLCGTSQQLFLTDGAESLRAIVEPKRPRGRPPGPPSYPISIRVTMEQNEAYKAAGGAKWLKSLLDKQIKKQK